jgi:hypothetical protein
MGTQKKRKSNKSKKRFRDGEIKLAILLITTHGNLNNLESLKTQNIDINIHKINATTPGVCNYIENDQSLLMGEKMSKFIGLIKRQWIADKKLNSSADLELTFGSNALAQLHIGYISQTLRSFMPQIDDVYKDTERYVTSEKIREDQAVDWNNDADAQRYRDKISDTYQLYKWKIGDEYMDKTYTIIGDERIETASNPYNNTITFLNKAGLHDSCVINMRYNLRSNVNIPNQIYKLSEILKDLKKKGYTDTIIIDLSCNVGIPDAAEDTERSSRNLTTMSANPLQTFPKHGGKKRKSNIKTRKTRRK